jgi:predicted DNA binding CopG/RHH family protein
MTIDKNLQNVVKDLDKAAVNAHHAQQLQQDTNDRRHMDLKHHDVHKSHGGDGTNGKG